MFRFKQNYPFLDLLNQRHGLMYIRMCVCCCCLCLVTTLPPPPLHPASVKATETYFPAAMMAVKLNQKKQHLVLLIPPF